MSNQGSGNTPYPPHVSNVRAINSDQNVGTIKDCILSLSPRVDNLCLQQHKLKGNKVEKNIWTQWKSDKLLVP
jgi:hypothetical protein